MKPLDIGTVWFGVRWITFGFSRSDLFGRTRLFTIEGVYEWRNRRYAFRWGVGLMQSKPEIFFNGPNVVTA